MYKIKLIFLFVRKHLFKILSIILLFVFTVLPFVNSSEVTFRIHDNLDSLGHLVMLSKSGQFLLAISPSSLSVELLLNLTCPIL